MGSGIYFFLFFIEDFGMIFGIIIVDVNLIERGEIMKKYLLYIFSTSIIVISLLWSGCYTTFGSTVKEDRYTYSDEMGYRYEDYSYKPQQQEEYAVEDSDSVVYYDEENPTVQNIYIFNNPSPWTPTYFDDSDWHISMSVGFYSGYWVDPYWDWYWYYPRPIVIIDPYWWNWYDSYWTFYGWGYSHYYPYNYYPYNPYNPYYRSRYPIAKRDWNKRTVRRDYQNQRPVVNRSHSYSNNADPVPVRGSRVTHVGRGGSIDIKPDPIRDRKRTQTLDINSSNRQSHGKRAVNTRKPRQNNEGRRVIRVRSTSRDRSIEKPSRPSRKHVVKPRRKVNISKPALGKTKHRPVYKPVPKTRNKNTRKIIKVVPRSSKSYSKPRKIQSRSHSTHTVAPKSSRSGSVSKSSSRKFPSRSRRNR